jgi:hypothetical protein
MLLAHNARRADIAISNQMGCPPRFPLLRPHVDPQSDSPNSIDEFDDFWPGLSGIKDINMELYSILFQMSSLTFYIEMYDEQKPSQRAKWLIKRLAQERNEIQYRLLSLPTTTLPEAAFEPPYHSYQRPADSSSFALAELTRLAALVYSDMVLFPTSYVTKLKHRLAARMHSVAKAAQIFDLGVSVDAMTGTSSAGLLFEHARLLVWVLWMGCFAAYQSELQDWFEEQLGIFVGLVYGKGQITETGLVGERISFEEMREGLSLYLWWGPVCDEPGRALWDRVGFSGIDSGYDSGSSPEHG